METNMDSLLELLEDIVFLLKPPLSFLAAKVEEALPRWLAHL